MRKIIAGNWKLNLNPTEVRSFLKEWSQLKLTSNHQIVVFPTAISAEATAQSISEFKLNLEWGLQNSWVETKGAFTGENSSQMAQAMGARWSLIGHSERRSLLGESDELLNRKLHSAVQLGLQPMFCIGEGLEERKSNRTFAVLAQQLENGLKAFSVNSEIVIAYEPVWAIGTGVVATPEQVTETHLWIHQWLQDRSFAQARILYGGSVKPENAQQLLHIPHVDGLLVGGASLKPADFFRIAQA